MVRLLDMSVLSASECPKAVPQPIYLYGYESIGILRCVLICYVFLVRHNVCWRMAVAKQDGVATKAPDVVDKWGLLVAERGFAQIPNYLLLMNQFLEPERRLSPVELLILFQLAGSWWRRSEMPFPSMGTLANRCGVSDRQIQRAVTQLEKKRVFEEGHTPRLGHH